VVLKLLVLAARLGYIFFRIGIENYNIKRAHKFLSYFSLSRFLVTNLSIFRSTTCNNYFFRRIFFFPTKGSTLNTTCVRIDTEPCVHKYLLLVADCEQTMPYEFICGKEWGIFIAIVVIPLPTVTATTIVTNLSFQDSH
jgi:hypothetical protein